MTRYLTLVIFMTILSGCTTINFDYPREESVALDPNENTLLKRRVDNWLSENPGPSGFYPLIEGSDALGARLRMIEAAEKTIDAQYFMLKADDAGYVFSAALYAAADRGVRVRFLIDDIFTTASDEQLAIIDDHPNIELRLFNPIARTGIDIFNYLGDFKSANRRMHNKSFIVDNQVAIVGGRNIANEYFELNTESEFIDFDMFILGSAAVQVSTQFDVFWNHERSLPMEAIINEPDVAELIKLTSAERLESAQSKYQEAMNSDLMRSFDNNNILFYSADAIVLNDDPSKLLNDISRENLILVEALIDIIKQAKSEVIVLTPYLIPGEAGVEFWQSIASKGVRVVIITNSLASNNHTAVHAGYAKYRKRLLRAGVELYEARTNVLSSTDDNDAQNLTRTMHTKAMIFDRERVFAGSLNLDPRSIEINSEMGIVVNSAEMSDALANNLLERLGEWTYRVKLNDNGQLRWHATINGIEVIETSEPQSSWWRKFSAWMLKIIPEQQL